MVTPRGSSSDSVCASALLPDGVAFRVARTLPKFWAGVLLCLGLLFAAVAMADAASIDERLASAETLKRADFSAFQQTLIELDSESSSLSPPQRQHLAYLQAWQKTYAGEYGQAIAGFKKLLTESIDPTLRARVTATLVNALTLARRCEDCFQYLSDATDLLPQVTDGEVRAQIFAVAALLYQELGQSELSLEYAERMLKESPTSWVQCGAAETKYAAILKMGKWVSNDPEPERWIAKCVANKQYGFAGFIRAHLARAKLAEGKADQAISLLLGARAEAESTRYKRLVSEIDSILALAYFKKDDLINAAEFAESSVRGAPLNEFTPPLIDAYRVLTDVAERRGDNAAALIYHKKLMAADKAYLDDVSARQMAFQMAHHQAVAKSLQIDALNQQNQLLSLKQDLADKAVETSRLYVVLLLILGGFISFWAYRTKRSQLYFMRQAQHDGLTGIFNRHHFIELSERAIEQAQRANSTISIVIIDLDHFKIINDAHGHAAGDSVLKQAVTSCRKMLEHTDVFGRLGGEEFGILLPDRDTEAAIALAEKCRLAIADADTGDGRDEFPISASFGVTSSTISGYKMQQLLAHADSALYLAKRHGRNRVEVYKGGPTHLGPLTRQFVPTP